MMAKLRMVNTKFWSDPWVMTKLNPLDRLLFLYLITNEHTNISGIYEISEHKIAFDTGIERDTLTKSMLPRLEPKVLFRDNWIILVNFPKHQNLKSADVVKGIQREFMLAPESVRNHALGGGWGEGLGMMPDTKPNLTKLTGGAFAPIEVVLDKPPKDLAYREVFKVFSSTKQGWMFHKAQIEAAKRLAIKPGVEKVKRAMEFYSEIKDDPMCPEIFTPFDLEAKSAKLASFKRKNNL